MKYLKTYEGHDNVDDVNKVPNEIANIIDDSLLDITDQGYNIGYGYYLNAYWGCKLINIKVHKPTVGTSLADLTYPISDLTDGVNQLISQLKGRKILVDYTYQKLNNGKNATIPSDRNIKFGEYKSGDPITLPNEIGFSFTLLFANIVKSR